MNKIKKCKFALFAVLVGFAVVALSSCDKSFDEPVAPVVSNEAEMQRISQSAQTRALSDYTEQTYEVNQSYKDAYQHYKQRPKECSWTSYVLATAAVVRGKGNYSYPYNGNYYGKISHVKSSCGSSNAITKLDWYCKKYDVPKYSITCWHRYVGKSDRDGAIDIILDHRAYNDTPFLYIGSVGTVGHYYIIWDIDWTGNEATSTVYYTDVNQDIVNDSRSYDDNVRSMSMGKLLNLNTMNNYNFLCLY